MLFSNFEGLNFVIVSRKFDSQTSCEQDFGLETFDWNRCVAGSNFQLERRGAGHDGHVVAMAAVADLDAELLGPCLPKSK